LTAEDFPGPHHEVKRFDIKLHCRWDDDGYWSVVEAVDLANPDDEVAFYDIHEVRPESDRVAAVDYLERFIEEYHLEGLLREGERYAVRVRFCDGERTLSQARMEFRYDDEMRNKIASLHD
jgi:hypothetical protein